MQLGDLRHVALCVEDCFLRADTGSQQVDRGLTHVVPQLLGLRQRRQRVQIDDRVDALISVLQRDEVLDRAEVVADVLSAGRADAREHAILHIRLRLWLVVSTGTLHFVGRVDADQR